MAKGLDDLLDFLVKQVAIQGETGASTSDVAEYAAHYYEIERENLPGTESDKQSARIPDRPLLECIWGWLSAHPDIHCRPNDDFKKLSLDQVERHNEHARTNRAQALGQNAGLSDSPESINEGSEIRLFASEEQMWLALTGHGPDLKRVAALEFTCLSVIGAHRHGGIVQPLLTQITGQDKRSVPERTRRLAEKGYIVKRKVLSNKAATSLCILRQFATDKLPTRSNLEHRGGTWVQNRFSECEPLIREALEIIEERKLVTWVDLRALLDIPQFTAVGKRILEALRRFEYLECLERVRSLVPTGPTVHGQHVGYRAFRWLRSITEEDWDKFFTLKRDHMDGALSFPRAAALEQDSLEDDVQYSTEITPLWNPDHQFSNTCYKAITATGTRGAITYDACELATGSFFNRSSSGMLHSMSNTWHADRSLEFAVLRDSEQHGKKTAYRYYTFDHFKQLVDRGQRSWNDVKRPAPAAGDTVQPGLFGSAPKRSFHHTKAILKECLQPAISQVTRPLRVSLPKSENTTLLGQKKLSTLGATGRRLSRGIGTRKYAVQYSEEELKAMPLEKRKRIMNSIEMGRRYHRRKLQEIIDANLETGRSFESILDEMEIELEYAAAQSMDSATAVKLDIVQEMSFKHRNSIYLPSKAAHSKHHFPYVENGEIPKVHSKQPSAPRRKMKPFPSPIGYYPSMATHNLQIPMAMSNANRTQNHTQSAAFIAEVQDAGQPVTARTTKFTLLDSSAQNTLSVTTRTAKRSYTRRQKSYHTSTESAVVRPHVHQVSPENQTMPPRNGRQRKQTDKALALRKELSMEDESTGIGADGSKKRHIPTLTYEQQYALIQKDSPGLFFGPMARLKKPGRGQGPRSQLLVFRLMRLSTLSFFANTRSHPLRPMGDDLVVTEQVPDISLDTSEIEENLTSTSKITDRRLSKKRQHTEDEDLSIVDNTKKRKLSRNLSNHPNSNFIDLLTNENSGEMRQYEELYSRPDVPRETLDNVVNKANREPPSGSVQTMIMPETSAVFSGGTEETSKIIGLISSVDETAFDTNAKDKSRKSPDSENFSSAIRDPSRSPLVRDLQATRTPVRQVTVIPEDLSQNHRSPVQVMAGVGRFNGSTTAGKKKIILDIVRKCHGIFPGDREMWYPFTTEWLKLPGVSKPDTRTITSLLKQLVDANKLRKIGFNFLTANKEPKIKHIITLPEVRPDDERIDFMRNKIICSYPRLYVPEEAAVSEEFRRHPETWWTPGQPRNIWADKRIEVPITMQPMPTNVSQKIRGGSAKTAAERLKAWHDDLVYQERQKYQQDPSNDNADNDNNVNEDEMIGQSNSERVAPKKVVYFSATDLKRTTRLEKQLKRADNDLGPPDFVIDGYQTNRPSQFSSKDLPARKTLQSSFHVEDLKTTPNASNSASINSTRNSVEERQKRIDRLAALKVLDQVSLTSEFQPSQNLANRGRLLGGPLNNTYLPLPTKQRFRLPRLPRVAEHKITDDSSKASRYKFSQIQVAKLEQHSVRGHYGYLIDHDQIYFSATRTFGTFLVQPCSFVPKSLKEILSREYPGKSGRSGHANAPLQTRFGRILHEVEEWEKKDPSAATATSKEYNFINISQLDVPAVPIKPRRVLVPQTRAERQAVFTDEPSKKHVLNEKQQSIPNKRCRISTATLTPELERHIVLAVVISKALFQSGDERYINWDVVCLMLEEKHEVYELKRLWQTVRSTRKEWLEKLQTGFESEFFEAYESGEIPLIRYDDISSNNWTEVMKWAKDAILPLLQQEKMASTAPFNLPHSRRDLEQTYVLSERYSHLKNDIYEIKQKNIRQGFKKDMLHRNSYFISEEQPDFTETKFNDKDVALSWVRATALTPKDKYDAETASQKLRSVPELDINSAVNSLIDTKTLVTRSKGRDTTGRVHEVSDRFSQGFKVNMEVRNFKQAAAYKRKLDSIFESDGSATFSYHADEGHTLAVINMLNAGRIKTTVSGVKSDLIGPNEVGYRTRVIDKDLLIFDILLEPTDKYVFGKPLRTLPRPPRASRQRSQLGLDKTALPAWVDIHGKDIEIVWEQSVCFLLSIIAIRPGLAIDVIEEYAQGSISKWEILLIMNWVVRAGVGEWENAQCSAIRLGEWWWLALDSEQDESDLSA